MSRPVDVQLDRYSGPLDLLVQLIQKQEMDIFHIDISKIINPYLNHLKHISAPDLEYAGQFIQMAVKLMYIKSKTLLPEDQPEENEEETPEEMKKKLTQLLAVYQVFQKAACVLRDRSLLGRDTWPSGSSRDRPEPVPSGEIEVIKDSAPMHFMKNCRKILISERKKQPLKTSSPLPSLMDCIQDMAEVFERSGEIPFGRLVKSCHRKPVKLLAFLSLLELAKLEFVLLFQEEAFSDIFVTVKKPVNPATLPVLEGSDALQ